MLLNKKFPLKYIFSGVKYEILIILVIGIVIHTGLAYVEPGIIDLPMTIPAFLGTAISILLSFKMSQSYDRWWEARKIWGSIVNDSRSLVIQLQSFSLMENTDSVIRRIAIRQIAWCFALGESLRKIESNSTLQKYLSKKDIETLEKFGNKPLGIIQLNAYDIKLMRKEGHIDSINHAQLDNTLTRLCESMGKAERINNTVFPPKYRLILKRTIILFSILLSVSLQNMNVAVALIILMLFSLIFLLLENVALVLQDPFGNKPSDTAVTFIAQNIEVNIRQLLDEEFSVKVRDTDNYYII